MTTKPLTENEARDLCRTDETLGWDLNLDKQPTWYGLTSTGARNVYRTIGPKAETSALDAARSKVPA